MHGIQLLTYAFGQGEQASWIVGLWFVTHFGERRKNYATVSITRRVR